MREIREEVLIRDNNRVIVSNVFRLHEKQTQVAERLRLAVKLSALSDVYNSFSFSNRRIKKDESKIK